MRARSQVRLWLTHFSRFLSISGTQDTFEGFHGHAVLLFGHGEVAHGEHAGTVRSVEAELDLGLDFFLVRHVWVMHKGATLRVGWLIACGGVLKTFNDGL